MSYANIDLEDFIDKGGVGVLNNAPGTSGDDVLGGNGSEVYSDCDAQLLYLIPFSEAIVLSSFSIRATEVPECKECEDDASPPATVKLFINNLNMDFDDAEDSTPAFEYELKEEELKGKPIQVKRAKFSNVVSIALFIESNQDESEVTFLNRITFTGRSIKGTDLSALKNFPAKALLVEIIPNLYLGNIKTASDKVMLEKNNITHVLGITKAEIDYWEKLKVRKYSLNDTPGTDLSKIFEESIGFINAALNVKGNKVLVHCRAGISRSVTIICAYLIATKRITAKAALKLVRKKRSHANPNFGFWKQLREMQRLLNIKD